jgi:hypothetical protein
MKSEMWILGCLGALVVAAGAVAPPVLSLDFDAKGAPGLSSAGSAVRVPGVRGEALWFWGEPGQGVAIPPAVALDMTAEVTVSAWIWVRRFGDHQTLVWKGDRKPVVDRINYRLAVRPEGTLEFSFKGPADEWWQIASPAPVPLGQWVQVAASFDRGNAALDVGGKRVVKGRMKTFGGAGAKESWPGDRMLTNAAPLEIGAGQEPSGEPGQFFCGAIDEVRVWSAARPTPAADTVSLPSASPLASLKFFEKSFTAEEVRAAPFLVGRVSDARVPWMLEVGFPGSRRAGVKIPGVNAADGAFRYLLDDFCGAIHLRGAARVSVCGYRRGGSTPLAVSDVALRADNRSAEVIVDPDKPLQKLRGFGCYADLPKTFLTEPEAQEREYVPLLDALREAGVTQLDFSFGTQLLEPQNDDDDPQRINWEPLRKRFAAEQGARTLVGYINYVQARGFAVGLRAISFAGWQWEGQGTVRSPKADEVAESCVALLTLLREECVTLTHLVPVWEPAYPPEAVAEVCAKTARLAKQHGFDLPIVGPYRIATGGQSMDMDAMPDRYLNGQRYVEAYLKAMGEFATVVGVEDYASGWAMTEPNLKRLQREVIEPAGPVAGRPRELWLLEYGPLCGVGPWNFYPSRWHGAYAGYESGFRLARMVHQELNGGVSSFYFWKAYDGVGDGDLISSFGLIKSARHDRELRPPYHAARVLWRQVPRGARHLACTAGAGVLANAFVKDGRFTVLLTNPRSCSVTAEVRFGAVTLAPQAVHYSATERVAYQACDVSLTDTGGATLTLAPRSVNALVCRTAYAFAPFQRTVWPEDSATNAVYLSDLQWSAVSVAGKRELLRDAVSGMGATVRQDETTAYGWLTVGGVRYRKGLGTQTPSEAVYALDGGYSAFEAVIGIDDASRKAAPDATAVFSVALDGKTAFTSGPVKSGQAGQAVRVPCAGAKTLRLTVTGADGVLADWCEARLLR